MKVEVTLSGEIAIKGPRSRHNYQYALLKNIENVVKVNSYDFEGGVIYLDIEGDVSRLSKVFGVAKYYVIKEFKLGPLEDIAKRVEEEFKEKVKGKTFAVRVRRVGNHSFTSIEAAKVIGSALFPYSKGVDLENPEVEVKVDIRFDKVILKLEEHDGPKGLPVGTSGTTVALISGGFDSAVASWLMMKRGAKIVALNFALGGNTHLEVVKKVIDKLEEWSSGHRIRLFVVPGEKVLPKLSNVKENIRVVVLKRVMYKTAEVLAERVGAYSVTTGESLSQVSSQTMANLYATNYGINIPVMRPLIGFDKDEILALARRIGTYEMSAGLPEYCALSQNSTTHANPREVVEEEENLGLDYENLPEEM